MTEKNPFLALMANISESNESLEACIAKLKKHGSVTALVHAKRLMNASEISESCKRKSETYRSGQALVLLLPGILQEARDKKKKYLVIKAFRDDFEEERFGEVDALKNAPHIVWGALLGDGMSPSLEKRWCFNRGDCYHINVTW